MLVTPGLLAAILLMAACGGGHTATPRPPGPAASAVGPSSAPAKAQYIREADAICQQLRRSLTQFQPQIPALTALGDTRRAFTLTGRVFRRVEGLERGELARLQALPLPAEDPARVTSYLRAGTRGVALVARLAAAFERGNQDAIAAAEREGARVGGIARNLARAYGFKVCGKGTAGFGLS